MNPSVLRSLTVRGHALSPLTDTQLDLFKESSGMRVQEVMLGLVVGGELHVEEGGLGMYLAYVSNRDGLGAPS